MTRLIPVGQRLLVKQEKASSMIGSIHIPEQGKVSPPHATVIELGTGRRDKADKEIPFSAKKGERILMENTNAIKVMVSDEELLVIPDSAILAVFC